MQVHESGQLEFTKEERLAIQYDGYADPVFFCGFFLQDWFPVSWVPEKTAGIQGLEPPETATAMPWVHRGILAILTKKVDFLLKYGELEKIQSNFTWTDEEEQEHPIFELVDDSGEVLERPRMHLAKFTEVMMPRGFSKTTLINGAEVRDIVYKETSYTFYLSETATHAQEQLANVRREMEENHILHAVFGQKKPAQRQGKSWSEEKIETTDGVVVRAAGRGGQVRGKNHRGRRPDKIILDDVEDSESVNTDEQRIKTQEWFHGDVEQALPRMDPNASIVTIGTLLHEDALLRKLQDDPRWNSIVFGAVDKQGEPLWRQNMDERSIELERQSYARKGMLHIFYRELFNQIRNPETAKFRPEMLRHAPCDMDKILQRSIALDPAISQKPGADFSAIVVCGVHEQGWFQILETWGKQGASPREQIDTYFELAERYLITDGITARYGIESIAYQAALIHLMREEMFRRGSYFEITPITHSQKKEERIEGILQPRYANGFIVHQKYFPLLETQLLDWPNNKMDLPDATAMAVSLLDEFAALAAGPDIDDPGDDEYEPLDKVFGGDWRTF